MNSADLYNRYLPTLHRPAFGSVTHVACWSSVMVFDNNKKVGYLSHFEFVDNNVQRRPVVKVAQIIQIQLVFVRL